MSYILLRIEFRNWTILLFVKERIDRDSATMKFDLFIIKRNFQDERQIRSTRLACLTTDLDVVIVKAHRSLRTALADAHDENSNTARLRKKKEPSSSPFKFR